MGQTCQNQPGQKLDFNDDPNSLNSYEGPHSKFARQIKETPQLNQKIAQILKSKPPLKSQSKSSNSNGALSTKKYLLRNGTVYQGEWEKGKMNGFGRFWLPDGSYFEGDIVDNEINGYGRIFHANGEYYEGEFVANQACGKGKYYGIDSVYEGSFKANKQHGQGVEVNDIFRFQGEFLDGKKAKGHLHWKQKDQFYNYEGELLNNKFHGRGLLKARDSVYEGDFLNGQRSGSGKLTLNDGTYYIGAFLRDKKNGHGSLFDSKNHVIKTGTWKSDVLE